MPDEKNDATPAAAAAPFGATATSAGQSAAGSPAASPIKRSPSVGVGASGAGTGGGGWLSQAKPVSTALGTGSVASRTQASGSGAGGSPRTPEDLEEVIQVIPRRAWYAGVGALIMCVLIMTWALFGEVQTLISANGILVRPGGVRDVYPEGAGNVHEIFVKQGDAVQVGDPIARVVPIGLARDRLNVESEIATLNTQARMLRGQLTTMGMKPLTGTNLPDSDQDALPRPVVPIDPGITPPAAGDSASGSTPPAKPATGSGSDNSVKATRAALTEVEKRSSDLVARLRKLEMEIGQIPMLRSPLGGFVVELNVSEGMDVDIRSSIVQLELTGTSGADLLGVLFVDSADASTMVKVGMIAEIRPPGLSNETGSLIGEVSRVATFPSNKKQMMRIIGHEELVNLWLKDRLLKEVQVTLRHKKAGSEESGYEWTGLGASAMEIPSGTICTAQIVVKKTAPIGYIFPLYQKAAR